MDEVATFARRVARELRRALADRLVAVYLHGSAAFGDFDPRASDVDLLVVLADDTPPSAIAVAGDVLHSPRPCPGVGIEASAVAASAAKAPCAPWPFLVHVTTQRNNDKVVLGAGRDGDPDLVLHYEATRAAGIAIDGPSGRQLIGVIEAVVVLEQMRDDLLWAVQNASGTYAVLNVCRALRYQREHVLCSKTAGGVWALENDIAPSIVAPALTARQRSADLALDENAEAWLLSVADSIKQDPSRGR